MTAVPVPGRARTRTHALTRTITVTRTGGRLAGVRADLGRWLGDHPRVADAVTVADELLTNAVRHGSSVGGRVTLVARRLDAGRLAIDVTDAGRQDDAEAPCITAPPFGAGLHVVDVLCESVEVRRGGGGWHVRVVLAARPPEIREPDVDVDVLLDAYPDDVPGDAPGGDRGAG